MQNVRAATLHFVKVSKGPNATLQNACAKCRCSYLALCQSLKQAHCNQARQSAAKLPVWNLLRHSVDYIFILGNWSCCRIDLACTWDSASSVISNPYQWRHPSFNCNKTARHFFSTIPGAWGVSTVSTMSLKWEKCWDTKAFYAVLEEGGGFISAHGHTVWFSKGVDNCMVVVLHEDNLSTMIMSLLYLSCIWEKPDVTLCVTTDFNYQCMAVVTFQQPVFLAILIKLQVHVAQSLQGIKGTPTTTLSNTPY